MRAIWIAVLLTGACGAPVSEERRADDDARPDTARPALAAPDTAEQSAARRRFVTHGLRPQLVASRAGIAARLGAPDSVLADTEPNRHMPGQTDSLFAVHYPGLVVRLRKAGDREFLESAAVRDDRWLADSTVTLGMTEQETRRRLGHPQHTEQGQLGYLCLCGGEVEEPVWLVLEDGRVREIRFTWYVD